MEQAIIGFSAQMDVFWFLQMAFQAAAWVVLGQPSPVWQHLRPRMLLEFILIFMAFNAIAIGGIGLASVLGKGANYFLLLRVTGQSLITACYMIWFASGRRRTRLILWLALTTVSMCITHIGGQASMLTGRYVARGAAEGTVRVVFEMVTIYLAIHLRHFQVDEIPNIPASSFGMMSCNTACVLALYIAETLLPMDPEAGTTKVFLLAYSSMLVMMLVSIQALYALGIRQKEVAELQAEKQRMLSEKEQTRVTEAMLQNLRAIRHDLKNQYAYMQILLADRRYEELKQYFEALQEGMPQQLNIVDCGNHTLNTVLNMEFSKLRNDRITIEHQLIVPPVLPFRDEELCSILSNLLDNARDECRRLLKAGRDNTKVRLEIYPHQSYLYICCMNSTDKTSIERQRRGIRTTNSDTDLHGYGTQIIGKLAEKYNGLADYFIADGIFTAKVMLDMTTEDKS